MLHALLEAVPFRRFSSPEELLPHLQIPDEFMNWQQLIAEMVYKAFHTPLPLVAGPTALVEIDPLKQYRETEFLFPWEEGFQLHAVQRVPGLLKGVIDLLFEHEGKFYLLDWKSNKLENYQQPCMKQAMEEGGYFLQAEVYTEALRRYLALVDPGPFEERFGGILYVFLRGLKDGEGVYRIC